METNWLLFTIIGIVLILSALAFKDRNRLLVILVISVLCLAQPAKAGVPELIYPAPVLPGSDLTYVQVEYAHYQITDSGQLKLWTGYLAPDPCNYRIEFDVVLTDTEAHLQAYLFHSSAKACIAVPQVQSFYYANFAEDFTGVLLVTVNGVVAQEN